MHSEILEQKRPHCISEIKIRMRTRKVTVNGVSGTLAASAKYGMWALNEAEQPWRTFLFVDLSQSRFLHRANTTPARRLSELSKLAAPRKLVDFGICDSHHCNTTI